MKISNLNLNLKKVSTPSVIVTAAKPIGITFNQENVKELVKAAQSSKVNLNADDINILTSMLHVFSSPNYNENVAISGTPEESSVISKAIKVFQKGINAYWAKNFKSMEVNDESLEKDFKTIVEYIQDNLLFYVGKGFKPQNNGSATPMKSLDYLLVGLRNNLEAVKTLKPKMPETAKEVCEYLIGSLAGLYDFIQKGRANSITYMKTGSHGGYPFNTKPTTTEETAISDVFASAISIQADYAARTGNFAKEDVTTLFMEEAQNKEWAVKTLIANVVETIFNPNRYGEEETVIENIVKEANEEFEDSFVGSHKNTRAIENIEVPTEKVSKTKK